VARRGHHRLEDGRQLGSFAAAVSLSGITGIAAGESAIFIETGNLASARTAFLNTWFGANPPAGLQIGSYSGASVGLSASGDPLFCTTAAALLQAKASFAALLRAARRSDLDNAAPA